MKNIDAHAPWSPEDYHYYINRAKLFGFSHLADALLLCFAREYPGEVPEKVLSLRGTRRDDSERSEATHKLTPIANGDDAITVPENPRKG